MLRYFANVFRCCAFAKCFTVGYAAVLKSERTRKFGWLSLESGEACGTLAKRLMRSDDDDDAYVARLSASQWARVKSGFCVTAREHPSFRRRKTCLTCEIKSMGVVV